MFERLVKFEREHSHCNVPKKYEPDPQLGTWVSTQRGLNRRGKLSRERIDQLEKIGFAWNRDEFFWEEMFERLVKFEREHSHCNVPAKYEPDPQLGAWVSTQRGLTRRGKLSQKHVDRLHTLTFSWNLLDAAWEEAFQRLVAFKREHSHCNVPARYKHDPELASWVTRQRRRKRLGKLSSDRIARLDAQDFYWDIHDATWEDMSQRLAAFKREHGHCKVPRRFEPDQKFGWWVRHTAITNLAATGADIPTIQEFSGHLSLKMVMRYAHAQDRRVDLAIDEMERAKTKVEQIGPPETQNP